MAREQLDAWYRRRTEDLAAARSARDRHAWESLGVSARSGDDDPVIGGQAGANVLAGSSGQDQLQAKQARPELSGRPGLPAVVAGVINRIAGSPNNSAGMTSKGVDVTLRRGRGSDVAARADLPGGDGFVSANGRLDPPSARKEVSFSDLRGLTNLGRIETFPTSVRVFNTATGELRYEIYPGLRIRTPLGLRIINRQEGQYVIK